MGRWVLALCMACVGAVLPQPAPAAAPAADLAARASTIQVTTSRVHAADQEDTCGDVIWVGARGSGQTRTGNRSMGPEVNSAFEQYVADLAREPGTGIRHVSYYPLGYRADDVGMLFDPRTTRRYFEGLGEGVDEAVDFVVRRHEYCPNEGIVLAGVSQGAMVVHRAIWNLDQRRYAPLQRSLLGVVAIADGDRWWGSGAVGYGSRTSTDRGWDGGISAYDLEKMLKLPARQEFRAQRLPGWARPYFHSICNRGDAVCDTPHVLNIAAPAATPFGLFVDIGGKVAAIRAGVRIHSEDYRPCSARPRCSETATAPVRAAVAAVARRTMALLPPHPPLVVHPTAEAEVVLGRMVDIALPVSGGVAPRSRVLTDGPDRLPYGLRLSRDGHVFGVVEEDGGSGEPVRLGRYDVRVGVDDVTGTRATIDLRLEVVEPPAGSSADWASLAGSFAKCGVRVDGVGSCWGWNDHGTVGDGTGHDSDRPVPLAGRWREIVSRGATTCGVQSDGSGWCWGRNDNGQVGDGSTEDRVLPTRLPGTWRTILLEPVLGSTACGIRTDASGWCWGYNGYAQVGDGTNVDRLVPTRLRGEWARLTLSSYGACGVRTDASGWCWGELDLKPGPQLQHRVPQRVAGSWESLVAGTTPCGVRTDDTAWCWGANADGEVGVAGTGDVVWPPAQLPGRWRQVVGGDFSQGAATSCGIRTDGSGWCWGDNASGQVGDGTTVNRRVPRQLPGSWRSLVVSHDATVCGVQPDGSGWCWGSNFDGQLGDGTLRDRSTPTRLPGSWESVVVVAGSTCGVQVDGTGWCWGGGPAGDGETDDARVPTRVP